MEEDHGLAERSALSLLPRVDRLYLPKYTLWPIATRDLLGYNEHDRLESKSQAEHAAWSRNRVCDGTMIGTVLNNRYKLVAELANGGMAWVYLAKDLREEQQVAVKVLYPHLSEDVGFLQRFSQEAKLAMGFSDSAREIHVARVLDYGSDRDIHYLVMEYVKGQDLRRVLEQDGHLAWEEALDIARQVALALGYACQHSIVHRDIKPENIMVQPDGTVRVLDFGVARAQTSPSLTHSGFVGSPYYAAPEQVMGRSVDTRADLYSLGVVLYEMLTGNRPFQSDTPWGVANQHIATPPPLLEETYPDLPRSVARLVRKAMAKRPEDRFQTPTEMVQVIEAVLSGLELPLDTPITERDAMAPLLAGLYQRARQAAREEAWQEAVDLYSQILRFDARYRDVTEQLAEAGRQARLSALYSDAQRCIKTGEWTEALAQLDEIAMLVPGYRDVKALRAQVRQNQEVDRLYRKGIAHVEAGEWTAAIECLRLVQEREPSHIQAARLLATAHARQEKQKAQTRSGPAIPSPQDRPGRARRRNVFWAVFAVLIMILAVESLLFYRAQQPPVAAAVSAPAAATTPVVAASSAVALLSPSILPAAASTQSPPTLTPSATFTSDRSGTTLDGKIPTTPAIDGSPASLVTLQVATTANTTPNSTTATPKPALAGQIAFSRFDRTRSTYDVYTCHLDGSQCKRVATEASQPDFLPSDTGEARIVFHSWKPDDKGLVVQSLSGQRIWKITSSLEAARPSVDFQGKIYVYHSREEADRLPRLYRTYDSETRPIKREANLIRGLSPSWLPDGRILYSGCVGNACGILLMESDGAYLSQVVAGGSETNPEASPDGRRVAFMSQRDGNWEVYVINLDGTGLQRLTRNPANDGLPTWSPDGRYIAFVSDRDGSWELWVMDPDGGNQRRLFAIGGPLEGQVQGANPQEIFGWVEERISWSPLP
jgi:tetratricopeptide (TPR) repeat protein